MALIIAGDALNGHVPTTIGPGLYQANNETIQATKSGLLRSAKNGKIWLDSNQTRYVPMLNDPVVGQIKSKTADFYKVDVGGPHLAILPILAFEGASKRNHPSLQISLANKDMEPEIDCTQSGFGPLLEKPAFVTSTSLYLSRLLLGDHPVWVALSEFSFEVAVGINGRVWINSTDPKRVKFIVDCLRLVDGVFNEGDAATFEDKILPIILNFEKYNEQEFS